MHEDLVQARVGCLLAERYLLDGVLGHGGMGVVYSAHEVNGRRVAVKMLDPQIAVWLGTRPDIRAKFFVERTVAEAVKHPGIVGVYAHGETEDGLPFVVMEYLQGADVNSIWAMRGCLSAEPVVALLEQLLEVLQATHALAIVHRDIKPPNLFLLPDGKLKLLDFGVSSMTFHDEEDRSMATAAGAMLEGTPEFCAPETCQGRRDARDDPRVDIYGVGATAFALLTGKTVHSGETAMAIVYKAATQPAPLLSAVAPNVPSELAQVVQRALSFDPNGRWPSAAAMAIALRAAWQAMGLTQAPRASTLAALVAPVAAS